MSSFPEQIVTHAADLAEVCAHLEHAHCFGLDTEFVGEESYHPELCLVQVATAERLCLIDPLAVGPLDRFWKIVVDPANLVIVHAGREEIRLCNLWAGACPGNLFDLQIAAGLVGLAYPLSHASLVNQVLGVFVAKGETLTEWRDRPLSDRQVRYAFDDVRYLLPLWQELSRRLGELGRSDWAREEFTRLCETVIPSEPDGERWRKLRGIGSLDRRALAVVRELSRWRDQVAAETDRPVRTIVRDDLLVEIARRNPRQENDIRVIRGLPRRHAAAILNTVNRARSIPIAECPPLLEREQDPPQASILANLLSALLGHLCNDMKLAGNLVATNQDIKRLVRAHLEGGNLPADSVLATGWRSREILPRLQALLRGQLVMRVANPGSTAPLHLSEPSPPQSL
jgi:ribonuclease D